jgi:3-deoxy-D-manno-octulosonic acid kinase
MTAQTLNTDRGFILYDDVLVSHAGAELFSHQYWARGQAPARAVGGRGQAWIVAGAATPWVLRHYRRGGLAARFTGDLYFWSGLLHTRPWREWRLLADLYYEEGLPVPQPVAAQVRRQGPCYRGDLITALIPDSRSLAARWQAVERTDIPWADIGACIRRFHTAGVYHADLNAHNILLDGHGRVYLIDFDRGRRRPPAAAWQRANLKRLQRSLAKLSPSGTADAASWNTLLEGYRSPS